MPVLFERLREHYSDEPGVEVVPELRSTSRRRHPERRRQVGPDQEERRQIRNTAGRRVADRRVPLQPVSLPRPLPPEAEPYVDSLIFFERQPFGPDVMEDAETARLVLRFQAGEREVFSELYLRYFDRVYLYLCIALHDDREAEDATQDVFMRVLGALDRYERRGRPFRAWLFTIVRNLALDRLRRRNRVELLDPIELRDVADVGSGEDISALDWIADRELGALIERLPASQRQVVVLRYMLDLGIQEIAQVMDLEPGHVGVLHHRAMKFLRERLGPRRLRDESGCDRAPMLRRRRWSPVTTSRRLALIFRHAA
jgi:RNA polymerase sigma-70 factor (ECF subfamily)